MALTEDQLTDIEDRAAALTAEIDCEFAKPFDHGLSYYLRHAVQVTRRIPALLADLRDAVAERDRYRQQIETEAIYSSLLLDERDHLRDRLAEYRTANTRMQELLVLCANERDDLAGQVGRVSGVTAQARARVEEFHTLAADGAERGDPVLAYRQQSLADEMAEWADRYEQALEAPDAG